MMPTNMAAPELLCAVRAGRAVMLEMWFIGGDGSRDDPALLTMIGELDSHSARPVPAAAEGLIQRTGPWVIFDFSGVTLMDGRDWPCSPTFGILPSGEEDASPYRDHAVRSAGSYSWPAVTKDSCCRAPRRERRTLPPVRSPSRPVGRQ